MFNVGIGKCWCLLISGCVQKGQKHADVLLEWSLRKYVLSLAPPTLLFFVHKIFLDRCERRRSFCLLSKALPTFTITKMGQIGLFNACCIEQSQFLPWLSLGNFLSWIFYFRSDYNQFFSVFLVVFLWESLIFARINFMNSYINVI